MTLEEKQQRTLDLINISGNIGKLLRKVIQDTLYTLPEDELDKMIATMEED